MSRKEAPPEAGVDSDAGAGVAVGHARRSGANDLRAPAVSLSEPLLDCEAAAALLNVRPSWVRDATRLGHLPCLRVGRHLRFTRPMLEAWLSTQLKGARAGGARRRTVGAARASAAPRFRQRTEAALLASLLETPARNAGRR